MKSLVDYALSIAIAVLIGAALFLGLSGCEEDKPQKSGRAQQLEMEITEANQQRLLKAVPPPEMTTSLERIQLKKRLERFNQESKISYIYLVSYGRIMAYYSIKGKVSSVNSLLTTPQQVVWKHRYKQSGAAIAGVTIASPDLDGSYGSNGDAIFFFTTEDIYVEWNDAYLLADQPLRMAQEPLLTKTIVTIKPAVKKTPTPKKE